MIFSVHMPEDPLAKLPALAARLGVEPLKGGERPTVQLITNAGERYDLFALINALLDRMEMQQRQ